MIDRWCSQLLLLLLYSIIDYNTISIDYYRNSTTYIKQKVRDDDIRWHDENFTQEEHEVSDCIDGHHSQNVIQQDAKSLDTSFTEIRRAYS